MMLRRSTLTLAILTLALASFVAGCGQKADETAAGGAVSDSLLAAADSGTAIKVA